MKFSGGSTNGPTGSVRPGSSGDRTGFGPKTGVVVKCNCMNRRLDSARSSTREDFVGGEFRWTYLEAIRIINNVYLWRFIKNIAVLEKIIESG